MKTKENILDLLKQTKRTLYVTEDVAKDAPQSEGGEVAFFKLDRYITDNELEKEYESRGLVPCDLLTLSKYDLENPKIMGEKKYVATHWKDAKGNWCFAAFGLSDGERFVYVYRHVSDWGDVWWFAGLRKLGTESSDPLTPALESVLLDLQKAITMVKEAGYKVYKEM